MNMRLPVGTLRGLGLFNTGIVGPWPCEKCHCLSQYADIQRGINRIFCKNEACRYTRLVDKRHNRIIEDDGTAWEFDNSGKKIRIRLP